MVPRIINESHPWSRLRQVGRGSATISHRTPDYVRADFTKLQRSLNATARPLACPAPDRTFTTELACAESLQTQVGYDYRNVRLAPDRTFTGCSVSLVGCTPTLSGSEIPDSALRNSPRQYTPTHANSDPTLGNRRS